MGNNNQQFYTYPIFNHTIFIFLKYSNSLDVLSFLINKRLKKKLNLLSLRKTNVYTNVNLIFQPFY